MYFVEFKAALPADQLVIWVSVPENRPFNFVLSERQLGTAPSGHLRPVPDVNLCCVFFFLSCVQGQREQEHICRSSFPEKASESEE